MHGEEFCRWRALLSRGYRYTGATKFVHPCKGYISLNIDKLWRYYRSKVYPSLRILFFCEKLFDFNLTVCILGDFAVTSAFKVEVLYIKEKQLTPKNKQ